MKTLLSVTLGCTIGAVAAMAVVHLGHLSGGVVIAGVAGVVLVVELVNAVRRTTRRRNRGRVPIYQRWDMTSGSYRVDGDR